jgi:uncharacterized protein YjbJ (UPF0337 family)
MNHDTAAGNWTQLKGKIKQKWGKLTDDDLTRAEGDKEYLVGKLHEQYGLAKDRAKDELDNLGYKESDVSDSAQRAGRMDMAGRDPESVDETVKADEFSGAGTSSPRNKLEAGVESPGSPRRDRDERS